MSPFKTLKALVAGLGIFFSSQSFAEPAGGLTDEEFEALYEQASEAKPFWMLVRDAEENLETCLGEKTQYFRITENFCETLLQLSRIKPEAFFNEITKNSPKYPKPIKWDKKIQISAHHPDPVIKDQIQKTVEALQGIEGLQISVDEDLSPLESDIVIYVTGRGELEEYYFDEKEDLYCPSVACNSYFLGIGLNPYSKPGKVVAYYFGVGRSLHDILYNNVPHFIDPLDPLKGNNLQDFWFFTEGFVFAPHNFNQVSGYLRANEEGEIKKAYCSIWLGGVLYYHSAFNAKTGKIEKTKTFPEHPKKTSEGYRRQMTTECILRSLGLTGALPDGLESSLAKNERPKDIGRYPDLTELDLELVKRHYKKN